VRIGAQDDPSTLILIGLVGDIYLFRRRSRRL
jgi:hypothetical protein